MQSPSRWMYATALSASLVVGAVAACSDESSDTAEAATAPLSILLSPYLTVATSAGWQLAHIQQNRVTSLETIPLDVPYAGGMFEARYGSILAYDEYGPQELQGQITEFAITQSHTLGQSTTWSRKCDDACVYAGWKPIGRASIRNTVNGGSIPSFLWHNPKTGQLAAWESSSGNNYSVDAYLTSMCGPANNCQDWQAAFTADLDLDGTSDIVWIDKKERKAGIWYLTPAAGLGAAIGVQRMVTLSFACTVIGPQGCQTLGQPFAAIDIDGDSNMDISTFDAELGSITTWRLDRAGNHIGSVVLDQGAFAGAFKYGSAGGYLMLVPN